MPPNFSAAKTPHIADRLEPGLVCFSAGGGCRLCNHAPKNAPGKGCVRDGYFGSCRFMRVSTDWRVCQFWVWLRVSQRRAAECPPYLFGKQVLF